MDANEIMQRSSSKKKVWDVPTRLAHWLLVILITYAWFAVEILEDMQQHFWAGYGVLSVILFRFIWGFAGTTHARFSSFLQTPNTVWHYAKTLSQRSSTAYLGHNPMGGLSALVLVIVILVQASTGLFNSDDYFHGPLSGLVGQATRGTIGWIHQINSDVLTALVGLHIVAIVFYKLFKRQSLTSAMITGNKPAALNGEAIEGSKLCLALLVLLVCAAIVYYIATGFTDTLPSSEFDYSF